MKIKVKQRDITDCGAACLASVAAYYKMAMPVARIRQYAGTDKKGTNVLGIITAAQKLGFAAKGVRGEWESLFKIPKPAIAHVIVKEVLQHYVVLLDANAKYIEYMDPGDGEIHKESHEEFKKMWTGVLVLLMPDEEFKPTNEKISATKRFLELVKPHQNVVIQTILGSLVVTILGLSTSVYVGKLVDYVIPNGNINLLNLMGLAMVAIILVQLTLNIFQSIFILKTGQRIDMSLILSYYKHLLKLPQQFFDNMRVGEIISRINDAVKIRAFINDVFISLVTNIFVFAVSFTIMFIYYWKLALIMLAIIPVYAAIYFTINKLNKRIQRKVMEHSADLESQLVESISAVGTIKRFGLEEFANTKTEARFTQLLGTIYKSGTNGIFSSLSTSTISQLFTIGILWIGTSFVVDRSLTPGELLSFYSIIGYFTGPVATLIGFNRTIQDALIASDRLFEIMDLELEENGEKINLTSEIMGDVMFENVSFRYGTRTQVFENLNLTIPHGKVTAIVGESGSGKTTLMSILQNIYPIQSGAVLVGGYNIKHISNSTLRSEISVVPQLVDLFAGNVIENIAVGEWEPDMKRIVDICNMLGIAKFIESLPNGYQTYLGENGATLSGGQKQRIAIARALYRKPSMLILDEATSSLDSIAESLVQNAIEHLKEQGKTVIIIAHRLSTVLNADKLIVLDNGIVVEEGKPSELIQQQGFFNKMLKAQGISA
jgi:ATP-binding cassette subfamily B protein